MLRCAKFFELKSNIKDILISAISIFSHGFIIYLERRWHNFFFLRSTEIKFRATGFGPFGMFLIPNLGIYIFSDDPK